MELLVDEVVAVGLTTMTMLLRMVIKAEEALSGARE